MELKTRQRLALSALFFQSGLCFSTWASRIPDIKEAFAFSDSELGSLLLIRPLGALFALPISGYVVDAFGSRRAATVGIIGFSISLVMLGLAPSVPLLGASILFFGMFANLLNISVNAQALVVQQHFGRVIMASFHGLWSLAGFCGAGIGALMLYLQVPVVNHFMLISLSVIILLLLSVRHLSRESGAGGSKKLVLKRPDRHLLILASIAFCGLICEGCMFDWSGVYFKQVIGAQEGMVAAGYMSFLGMMALGRFISDYFSNRYGSATIIRISGLLICLGLLTAVLYPSLLTGILGFFLVGAGTSSVIPLTYTEVGKNESFSPGIALAMVSTMGYVGFLLGPPLIGFIADLLSLRASFALVALVGLTITVIVSLNTKWFRQGAALPAGAPTSS
ncbi:MFS transporter [Cesiribacter andamanensis]|uniref:Inner membrane protein ybjJ n=1 Tax=Cesiribacter andamanensis AMV16 TaxID=1279009 RepID=M7N9X1_9BACT|nr:MFS transporter [Cesiribacter andamanensis]EMR04006.1 Inner membrane protein ybjJ [Cesiribacter andamanensis AMV16]